MSAYKAMEDSVHDERGWWPAADGDWRVIGSLLSWLGGEDRQFKLFFEEGNMRKGFLIVLAVVLVAVLAAPAMAGMDASGFVRVKGYVSNFYNGSD